MDNQKVCDLYLVHAVTDCRMQILFYVSFANQVDSGLIYSYTDAAFRWSRFWMDVMIAVIDYGAGNLCSVTNAISRLGYRAVITSRPEDVLRAKAVFLPGVGAAGDTMNSLKMLGLTGVIRRLVNENRHLLCICIGLQILFTGTEEGGWHECLNIIPGQVKKLPAGQKIPHMGWNQVNRKFSHPVFEGIPDGANFYFVHSFYGQPQDQSVVAAETDYGILFCSALARGNLVATQFHPEKSGDLGLRIYQNFIRSAGEIQC
jgi:glutamine amidotransferase